MLFADVIVCGTCKGHDWLAEALCGMGCEHCLRQTLNTPATMIKKAITPTTDSAIVTERVEPSSDVSVSDDVDSSQ